MLKGEIVTENELPFTRTPVTLADINIVSPKTLVQNRVPVSVLGANTVPMSGLYKNIVGTNITTL